MSDNDTSAEVTREEAEQGQDLTQRRGDRGERPILFSGEMVRAILSGQKTQTRRIVKATVPEDADEVFAWFPGVEWVGDSANQGLYASRGGGDGYVRHLAPCPFGEPGDRLWVRETWSPDHEAFYPYHKVVHRADYPIDVEDGRTYSPEQEQWYPFKWRPSIHMPRWACRLVLEVTAIRVERLQEISDEDAAAEGCATPMFERDDFRKLWNSIYGEQPVGDWNSNPFVWVVEFERVAV